MDKRHPTLTDPTVTPNVQYLSAAQAAKLFPSKPSACTVWRWQRIGVKAGDGTRIKLLSVRSGRAMLTTAEWCSAFMRELAERDESFYSAREQERDKAAAQTKSKVKRGRPKRSVKQRDKAVSAAKQRLAQRGI